VSIRISVLGLGEAGSLIARDLVTAGADLLAYDPAVPVLDGVRTTGSEADAVRGRPLVLAVTPAADAVTALTNAAAGLAEGQLYADLSTSSDTLKRDLARRCALTGAGFVDVALMSPVPGNGLRTPMFASGPEAAAVAGLLAGLGATVEVVGEQPGDAARRKLLRSVFYKGWAAAVVEALEAAERAGLREWLADNIAGELERSDRGTLDRLVNGSVRHARRRVHEMEAAADVVRDLGVTPHIAQAAGRVLEELRDRPPVGAPVSPPAAGSPRNGR
jgi:3-hydroxyisobutyrate dehydrogenase-like beta-hydroxyacid dehydrogenase